MLKDPFYAKMDDAKFVPLPAHKDPATVFKKTKDSSGASKTNKNDQSRQSSSAVKCPKQKLSAKPKNLAPLFLSKKAKD